LVIGLRSMGSLRVAFPESRVSRTRGVLYKETIVSLNDTRSLTPVNQNWEH
jgi:hypothetical protein